MGLNDVKYANHREETIPHRKHSVVKCSSAKVSEFRKISKLDKAAGGKLVMAKVMQGEP